jgi:predicted GNAT superfamily acetyltransferase
VKEVEHRLAEERTVDVRRAIPEDCSGIIRLQNANLITNLSAEERKGGFLSAEFTCRQFEEIANDVALIVASEKGQVLGFLCAATCDYYYQFPLLATMVRSYDRVLFGGKTLSSYNSFIYGPVCINKSHRGRGLLRGLYQTLLKEVGGQYEVGSAFVSKDNPHSLAAHVNGLGMTNAGEFEFRGRHYDIVTFYVDS